MNKSRMGHHLYKRTDHYEFSCVYCGMPCTGVDHFPPLKHVHVIESGHVVVPCCKECNDMAGDSLQESLEERTNYIKTKIYQKYKHKFLWNAWDDPEVREVVERLGWRLSGCTVVTRGCTTMTRDGGDRYGSPTRPVAGRDEHGRRVKLDRYSQLSPINKIRWRVRSATVSCKKPYSKLPWEYPPIR
jgi:hypothetical protein